MKTLRWIVPASCLTFAGITFARINWPPTGNSLSLGESFELLINLSVPALLLVVGLLLGWLECRLHRLQREVKRTNALKRQIAVLERENYDLRKQRDELRLPAWTSGFQIRGGEHEPARFTLEQMFEPPSSDEEPHA